MGAWGFKALESDSGLDVINIIENLYKGKKDLVLSEIISELIKEDFLTEERDNIDFLYDNTAQSVAELVLMYENTGKIRYDNEDEDLALANKTSFSFDEKSLKFILQYLEDIKAERPDEDGEREVVELWRDSDSFQDWLQHLDSLITDVKGLITG